MVVIIVQIYLDGAWRTVGTTYPPVSGAVFGGTFGGTF